MKKLRSLLALVLVVAMISSFATFSTSALTITVNDEDDLLTAINDAEEGTIIQLTDNIEIHETIILTEGKFTIDLNGHYLHGAIGYSDCKHYEFNPAPEEGSDKATIAEIYENYGYDNKNAIFVIAGADLTITNTSNNESVISYFYDCFLNIFGSLTISNVTFYGCDNAIETIGGTTTINETILDSEDSQLISIDGLANVTLNDCTVTENTCYGIVVYDGTVTINSGKYESSNFPLTAEGGNITINGGTFTSKIFDAINVDSYYSELDLTINNGIFKGNYEAITICGGNVTINGGEFENFSAEDFYNVPGTGAQECCVYIDNYDNENNTDAKVTFNGGTFKSTNSVVMQIDMDMDDEDCPPMDVIINGGTFTFDNEEFDPKENYMDNMDIGVIQLWNGNLTISNANISSNNYFCYGIYQSDGSITINNANVTADNTAAFYYEGGELNINGGTFDGLMGLAISSNEDNEPDVTLTGGLFKGADDLPENMPIEIPEAYVDEYLEQSKKELIGIVCNDPDFDLMSILGEGYSYYSADGKDEDCVFDITLKIEGVTEFNIVGTSKVVAVEKTDATISDGKDAKIDASKATDTLFKSDINYRWFENGEVKVDGKTVDSSNYTSASGSTDITLKASYLKTLSNGKHTLQIVSNVLGNKLVAETTFTVSNAVETTETEEVADTADNNMIGAFVALGMFSALGYTALKKKEN